MRLSLIRFSLVALLAVLLCSCMSRYSFGDMETRIVTVPASILSVEVTSGIQLILTDRLQPGTMSVEALTYYQNCLLLSSINNQLKISLKSGFKINQGHSLVVYASPELFVDYTASRASSIIIEDGVEGALVSSITLSDGSFFFGDLGMTATELNIRAASGSTIEIAGAPYLCNLTVIGGSKAKCVRLSCFNAEVLLSGASTAQLTVESMITGDLTGASLLQYRGDAKVNTLLVGSSKVEKL